MTEPAPGRGLRHQHKVSTRRALEDAALRRFARDGYDQTSVEAVAADAGVSARTFFRYFATKDAVLDMGREERQTLLRDCVRGLDPGLPPLEVVHRAVVALATGFAADRERVALRQRAAESSPVLRGRLFDIFGSWEHTLASSLGDRPGVDRYTAETFAVTGIAVFRAAAVRWLREPGTDLADLVSAGLAELGGAQVPG